MREWPPERESFFNAKGCGAIRGAAHQETDLASAPTCRPLARWKPRERDAATNVATNRGGHPALLSQHHGRPVRVPQPTPDKDADSQPLQRPKFAPVGP